MFARTAIELDARHPAGPVAAAVPTTPKRDLVLLVEDDDNVASLLVRLLERMNRPVVLARDGASCERLLQAHHERIALAFVDCSLPDTHGGSLCQKLRTIVPGLPVLLMSGRSQPGLLGLVTADGPAAFVSKPFLPADVVRHVSALLPAAA